MDLVDDFSDGRVQFAFLKVKDPNTSLPKHVLIGWCGEGVPERTKGYFTKYQAAVAKALHVRSYPLASYAVLNVLLTTVGLSCPNNG